MDRGGRAATMPRMPAIAPPRELDRRSTDGIDVRLCWSPDDNEVFVALTDSKTGDAFEVPVRAGESAHEVFHHPFAFAALPGRRRVNRESAPTDTAPAGRWRPEWLRDFAPAGRARAL